MNTVDTETLDLLSETATSGADFHAVVDHAQVAFTWDYNKGKWERLDQLCEKAKRSQWNAATDLDWS